MYYSKIGVDTGDQVHRTIKIHGYKQINQASERNEILYEKTCGFQRMVSINTWNKHFPSTDLASNILRSASINVSLSVIKFRDPWYESLTSIRNVSKLFASPLFLVWASI